MAWSLPGSSMSRKRKRDSGSNAALPQPVSIPPTQSFNGNDGMWSTFPLRIGRPPQDVLLLPSTAASEVWVTEADTGCPDGVPVPPATGNPDCFDSRGRLFNSNESATWIPNSIYTLGVEANLGLDSAANYGYENIVLGMAGSGGPQADHQVVANNADPRYWVGALGLNPQSTNFTNFVSPQPSLMQTLKNTQQIPSISYGYTAGAYYRDNHVLGSLTLGGYDANLVVANDVSIPFGSDSSRDLVANVRDIKSNTTQGSLLPGGAIYSFVDSTIPHIYLPVDACRAFENAFGLTWDPTWELYLVNDTQHQSLLQSSPSLTFTIGAQQSGGSTVNIQLPYAAFDMNVSFPFINSTAPPYLSTARYFPLKRAANDTQYTLGRTILQEAYLIADYENKNFSLSQRNFTQNSQTQLKAMLPAGYDTGDASNGKKLSAGAIAGIAVGGVAIIALTAALIFFVLRYNKLKKRAQSAQVDKHGSQPGSEDYYTADRKSGYIEPPSGHPSGIMSETDSAQRHEMPVPVKPGMKFGQSHYNDSSEVVGTEAAKELHADGTSGTTWEADSAARFELPGSTAPLGMSEKLGGARLSGRQEDSAA